MERESFEDNEVAKILNKDYVSIKVDREERPDIDHIYMNVCQILTGSGGWPMTIIMTPDKKPFFAGTYFPKHSRMGYTGLIELLERISNAWKQERNKLIDSAEGITKILSKPEIRDYGNEITDDTLRRAYNTVKGNFDEKFGGIGSAPKFPNPHSIMFLLRYYKIAKDEKALQMAVKTLESMYRGGIYDHIGFGFSRYSTDRRWLVPHFEKMLYDNALLLYVYTEAYQVTKYEMFKEIAINMSSYVLRDMTSPTGGFYSAEDADSEGEEGKFYLWDKKEILDVLGEEDGNYFCQVYGITDKGNFAGKNIPNLIENEYFKNVNKNQHLEVLRDKLYAYREYRVHPFKDDKILTSWNGLMIAAMAFAGRVFDNRKLKNAAAAAADFILKNMRRRDGRLFARYRDGSADHLGYLDDYSFFLWGMIELYQSTFEEKYIEEAVFVTDEMLRLFYDESEKGFFLYGIDGEKLITRPKELYDSAMPSGNSVAAIVMLKLSTITSKSEYEDIANEMFNYFSAKVSEYPAGYTHFLSAFMLAVKENMKIVLVGKQDEKETLEMLNIFNSNYLPHAIIALKKDGENGFVMLEGKPTAYICKEHSCSKPINDIYNFSKIILGN